MSHDDPIDDAVRLIGEGQPVDWDLAETKVATDSDQASIRVLRGLEAIAEFNRGLQRSTDPERGRAQSRVAPPKQWGHLTLLEIASAGKSGEIWRAWDAWLQREVALKFLFSVSEEGAEESALLEEARALARIRHPGVVNVYGIGAHAGRIGMWMDLLEGNTLESEIQQRGPLPPADVARIGLDLCRALGAVVAAGLVHRDIKPANIILKPDGRAVLVDFGLGRRLALADRETLRASGTPLFMAPELLAGEEATPISDLYALGVTLRWALTGRSPFRAKTLEELKAEAAAPPATRLREERPDAPAALADAIEHAMAPAIDSRYASATQFADALEGVVSGVGAGRRRRWLVAAVVAGIIAVGTAAFVLSRDAPRPAAAPAARFSVTAPPGLSLLPYSGNQAVSPDGRLLAFGVVDSTATRRIWIRPLGSLTTRLIEGTEGAQGLFWSPDGRYLGFFADAKLKKVAVSGGAPEVLCSAPDARGASWGRNGAIVFAPFAAGSLYRISSEGGAVTEILRPDSSAKETALRWPHFLPDGEHFLFVALPPRQGTFEVFAATPTSNERRPVMRAGCAPVSAGASGIIVASNGRLMLQAFDYDRLKPVGSPVALGRAPFSDISVGQPLATASPSGVVAHLNEPLANTELVWLDRSGWSRGKLRMPTARYEKMFFSPDGKRLLVERRDTPTNVELWLVDLERGESRRFAQGSQTRLGGSPALSPDGRKIAFSSNRAGRTNIYQRFVEEAGEEKLLFESDGQFKEVVTWSPDGKYVVFETADAANGWDLWLLPVDRGGPPIPYLRSRFNDLWGSISPDGKWMAYCNDATGRTEVYVRSFPVPGVEYHVANVPGRGVWSRDGREIIITQSDDNGVWSVPVSTTPTFKAGVPRLLFRQSPEVLWLVSDGGGSRFLQSTPGKNVEPMTIIVDVNPQRPTGH